MKQTLTTGQVADLLLKDENARWSYEAARALAEHYEELEQDSGEEMELDVVAIRCEWTEYRYASDIAEAYKIPDLDGLDDDEREEAILTYIDDNSERINLPNCKGFLVRQF